MKTTYSSPNAVFDACRQAAQNGDWRTSFFFDTQEARRYLVFGAHLACADGDGPAIEAVQKKFGPTEAAFGQRYFDEYKRKHGHADLIDKFLAKAVPY